MTEEIFSFAGGFLRGGCDESESSDVFVSQLGKPKAEALPEVLYRINPYLVCESRCEKVTPENVRELFADYPIVC
mgnify:CR=1 FL=1